jgi:hypothetical protein
MTAASTMPCADKGIAMPLANRADAERKVMMRLGVEADSLARLRQAVIATCGRSVKFLRTEKIPRSTLVWVWLVLAEAAIPDAVSATLRTVSHGEISRVFHQVQNLPKTRGE